MHPAYKNLIAWQRADDLFIELHQLTVSTFPQYEQFELGRQIRRAAYSVAANIVEGNARHHHREMEQFLNIAAASLSEVGYGLHAAQRLGYLRPTDFERLDLMLRQTAAPLYGLLARVRARKPLVGRPGAAGKSDHPDSD